MNRDYIDEDALTKRAAQERLLISKLTREDLEDKYLKVYDENILLKKHCRKQEEKIKKMATKLIRLVNDRKRSAQLNNAGYHANGQQGAAKKGGLMRDVETEELIAELQQKLGEAEMQNKRLRENLQINKIQLQTLQTQKKPANGVYDGVSARIDTGLAKRTISGGNTNRQQIRTISTNYNHQHIPQHQIDYGQLYNEKQELEDMVQRYQSQIADQENLIESLRMQLKERELNFEEDLLKLKNQVSHDHKQSLQENIDQIRLQRELKEKANQYTELYQKFNNLQQQHLQLKDNHDNLLNEIERYHQQLKQEQQRSLTLRTELKNSSHNQREILELKERVEDLKRDNEILKESNEKLLTSAFNLEREREFREREKALKLQIAQLEATLKTDVGEKGSILDKLTAERTSYDKLNNEFREMQVKYYEMKQKFDDMNEKIQFLSHEGNYDYKEIEEALIIVKERKTKKTDFVSDFENGKSKSLQRKINEMEAYLAETVRELDKQRHLLVTQVKINEDFKKEVSLLQSKMEENRAEYEKRTLEQAQLLDLRQARIKKLERQLKDIAYGTKPVRIQSEMATTGGPMDEIDDSQLVAQLERGQNIFEIHLTRIILSDEAIKLMNEKDPSTFCTIEFFEHELQTSPIIKGTKPEFNFTSQYVVKIDDFFLHYLQKETTTVELHQAFGSDYRTLAACQLSFRDIIDSNIPRLNGTARLISLDDRNTGVTFGTLEYWVRLVMPVDQAFRLYKERTKALGYISTNIRAMNDQTASAAATKKMQSADNMNELHVNILRCSRINSKEKSKQPAAYCVYKFFDFKDHDTEIIPASNYPEFNDHKSYSVHMDIDLDRYLRKESLSIYVFDDNQPENDPDYLGMIRIPLMALAHDKDIKGTFEILRADGTPNGTIDVNIYWQYTYTAPAVSTLSKSTASKTATNTQKPAANSGNIAKQHSDADKHDVSVQPPAIDHQKQTNGGHMANGHERKSSAGSVSSQKSLQKQPLKKVNHHQQQQQPQHDVVSPRDRTSPNIVSPRRKNSRSAHSSVSSDFSNRDAANSTIKPQNDNLASTNNYNDTYFGDDPRSMTQNDWANVQSELKRTTENNVADSIESGQKEFRRDDSDSDEIEEVTNNRESRDTDNNIYEEEMDDDEDVVSTPKASYDGVSKSDKFAIEIENFSLNPSSDAIKRDDIRQLFVSMNLLDMDAGELESPYPKPKPTKPNQVVTFNFRKEFHIDSEHNMNNRRQLARALVNEKDAIITFAVVSEPDDEESECEDIAYGYVDMNEILRSKEDFIGKQITLLDANDQKSAVGYMTVSVEILEALIAIRNEMVLTETQ